ncbi:uncharacterized, partial [Tachysurus ichikawai]
MHCDCACANEELRSLYNGEIELKASDAAIHQPRITALLEINYPKQRCGKRSTAAA